MKHLGFGYSSRQGAKNAKLGQILFFFFAAFASLREIFRFFWLRLRRARFSAVVYLPAYSQGCSWAAFVPAIFPATKHSVIFPAFK